MRDAVIERFQRVLYPFPEQDVGQRRPDALLYPTAPFDVTLERIRRRDRVGEGELDIDFLKRIYDRYEEWAESQTRVPLLRVDTTELDYVNRPEDAAEIVRRVETLLTEALVFT